MEWVQEHLVNIPNHPYYWLHLSLFCLIGSIVLTLTIEVIIKHF